jgi:ribosomal protein S27E
MSPNLNQLRPPVQCQTRYPAYVSPNRLLSEVSIPMYLLRCPQGHSIQVSTASAGNEVQCPECGAAVPVPKLGDLRRLPQAADVSPVSTRVESGFGARLIFGILLLVAIVTGGISAYGCMRWYNLPVPYTSEDHIRMGREAIAEKSPAELMADWQQYESMALTERRPFPYQQIQNLRDHWKRVCFIPLSISAVCVAFGLIVLAVGRKSSASTDT